MRVWGARLGLISLLLMPGAALAQEEDQPELDCDNAVSQTEMTGCAERDFNEADAALNAQYRKTRAAMRRSDAEYDKDQQGAEAALVTAQRAWIQYRDGHCDAYGFQAHLGSLEPMLIYACSAELTRARTKELKVLEEGDQN